MVKEWQDRTGNEKHGESRDGMDWQDRRGED